MSTSKALVRAPLVYSRDREYFEVAELQTMTGQPVGRFAAVLLKELLDNALDAAEQAGVAPVVHVGFRLGRRTARLYVADNGGGIPAEVLDAVTDFSVRVSDKAAYRSPTRGAQGNALKTIL